MSISHLLILVNVTAEAKPRCLGECKISSLLSVRRRPRTISQLQLCSADRILTGSLFTCRGRRDPNTYAFAALTLTSARGQRLIKARGFTPRCPCLGSRLRAPRPAPLSPSSHGQGCKQTLSEQRELLLCIKARGISFYKNKRKFINSKLLLKRSPQGERAQMLACIALVSQFLPLPPSKPAPRYTQRAAEELSAASSLLAGWQLLNVAVGEWPRYGAAWCSATLPAHGSSSAGPANAFRPGCVLASEPTPRRSPQASLTGHSSKPPAPPSPSSRVGAESLLRSCSSCNYSALNPLN